MPNGNDTPASPTNMVTPEDVRRELNFIESLRAKLSPQDDYIQALLSAQRTMLMMQSQQSNVLATPAEADDTSPFEMQHLPIDAVGVSNDTIYENDNGAATFQIQGTIFATRVEATEDIEEGQPVRVIGSGNEVRPTTNVPNGLLGITQEGFSGIGPDTVIDIQNQDYTQSESRVEPDVSDVTFNGSLDPGDIETVVQAQSTTDSYDIVAQEHAVTGHKADVDNDSADESIILYHYEYQQEIGGPWEELPGSPTTLPRGDLANTQPIGGRDIVVGPIKGYRIRFENRTDQTANQHSVDQEALGAIFKGRLTQG
jgi:hypothetical protein